MLREVDGQVTVLERPSRDVIGIDARQGCRPKESLVVLGFRMAASMGVRSMCDAIASQRDGIGGHGVDVKHLPDTRGKQPCQSP